jgi:putative addiction module CopG family antidote
MSLSIPPEFERAVRDRVESGAYMSAEEVFAACLEALAAWEHDEEIKLIMLRRRIDRGMEQYERGEYSPADEMFARLHARLDRSDGL